MAFLIEVVADASGKWAGNAMRYGDFQSAKDAAIDLANRWLLVTKARVVEFDEDENTVKKTVVFG